MGGALNGGRGKGMRRLFTCVGKREMGYIMGVGRVSDIDGGDNDSEQLFISVCVCV